MRVWSVVKRSRFLDVQRGFSEWSLVVVQHKLLRKHEGYTALAGASGIIERSLLDGGFDIWSLQEVKATNLIAHHVFHGGVSACIWLLSEIYVLIVFKNLWRKSFTAGAETSTVCTYYLCWISVLASIADSNWQLFCLIKRKLAWLGADPLLLVECLEGHGRKWKDIASAHSINLVNIFNRTDQSLTWTLGDARCISSLLPWRQAVVIEIVFPRTVLGAQIERLLMELGRCSICTLTVGCGLLILSLEWI